MVNIKRRLSLYLLAMLTAIFILNPMASYAEELRVFDDANLFTNEEVMDLENQADALVDSYGMDIIIVTTDNAEGKTSRAYGDDYFDENGFGLGEGLDGVLFLIDMDNREPYISTSGKGIQYLTDQRLESIIDRVFDNGLIDGDYYGASKVFLQDIEEYFVMGIPEGQYSVDEAAGENSLTLLEGIISLMSGGAASALFFFRTKSKYKMEKPVKPVTFRDNSIMNLSAEKEILMDTLVSNRPIPKVKAKEPDPGKSTTHTSSDGKTHGGGGSKGRKF